MKILSLFLCLLLPVFLYSADPEKLPPFTFTLNHLVKRVEPPAKRWINFTVPKQSKLMKQLKYSYHLIKPKVVAEKRVFLAEADLNINEATSIKGPAPKCFYRDERFLKGRFQGRVYTSPSHYYYLGGFRSLWWRDTRDVGVFAGSGIDF